MADNRIVSDTGKSINDYRDIIRTLKLKLKRLDLRNQELEELLTEVKQNRGQVNIKKIDQILEKNLKNSSTSQVDQKKIQKDDEYNDLCEHSLNRFMKSAMYMGITLEGIFRACDELRQKNIQVDRFRLFLQKLKLNLSQQEISNILYVFDENCNGNITYQQYVETLCAYNLNQEMHDQTNNINNIQTRNMVNFCQTVKNSGISIQQSFETILEIQKKKKDNSEYVHQWSLSQYYRDIHAKVNNGKLRRVDSVCIWNVFNYQKTQKVDLAIYEEVYLKYLNYNIKGSGLQDTNEQPDEQLTDEQRLQRVIRKFQDTSKSNFSKLLESLLMNISDPKRGIMVYDLQKSVNSFGKKTLTLNEVFFLFKMMDSSGSRNGTIYYDDLLGFFNNNKNSDWSVKFYVVRLAKLLQSKEEFTDDYVKQIMGSNELKDISQDEFCQKCPKMFSTKEDQYKDGIMIFDFMFNRDSKDITKKKLTVTVLDIVEVINRYRSDKNKDQHDKERNENDIFESTILKGDQSNLNYQGSQNLTQSQIQDIKQQQLKDNRFEIFMVKEKTQNFDVSEASQLLESQFDQLLDDIIKKQQIDVEACRFQPKFEPDIDNKPFETIYTNLYACLKKCQNIVKQCLSTKQKWVDPEFGSSKEDPLGLSSLYFYENMIPNGCPYPDQMEWRRPEEILRCNEINDKAVFFDQGASSSDVLQSQFLGDCWFISALSIMATNDHLLRGRFFEVGGQKNNQINLNDTMAQEMIKGVYCPLFHYMAQYGVYVMRFFKNYEWTYVIIDDRLPTFADSNEVIYGQCKPEEDQNVSKEFWVQMIEKGYAKLHNCYQALFSGYIDEALLDMTGLVGGKTDLRAIKFDDEQVKDKQWNRLVGLLEQRSMIGCSANGGTEHNILLDGEDTGLFSGHAYAVTDVFEIDNKDNPGSKLRLLRIRNPWGKGEWTMRFNDESEELEKYKTDIEKAIQLQRDKMENKDDIEKFDMNANDGKFFMEFDDWVRVFHNLYICYDFRDSWSGLRIRDRFTKDSSGGLPLRMTSAQKKYYAKNPQYLIEIDSTMKNKTEMFISISQQDGRLIRGISYPFVEVIHPILCYMYRLEQGQQRIEEFDKSKIIYTSGNLKCAKDITIDNIELENGSYILIPAYKLQDTQGSFTLSIYFSCSKEEIKLSKVGEPNRKFEIIKEEEEKVREFSDEEKKLYKLRVQHITN